MLHFLITHEKRVTAAVTHSSCQEKRVTAAVTRFSSQEKRVTAAVTRVSVSRKARHCHRQAKLAPQFKHYIVTLGLLVLVVSLPR